MLTTEIGLAALVCLLLVVGLLSNRSGERLNHALAALGVGGLLIYIWGQQSVSAKLWDSTYLVDGLSWFFKLLFLVAALLIIISSQRYSEQNLTQRWQFPALILAAVLGMTVMVSGGDLLVIYIGLELMTITFYILAAYLDKDLRSYEAGLKYLILGGVSSALLLLGLSLVYALTGTTNLTELGKAAVENKVMLLGMTLVLAGMGFKISAVPFHMWAPDIYEGAPTPVTAILSVASKAAGFAVLVRLVLALFPAFAQEYAGLLAILAAVTIILGNLAAIPQTNLKRMLAYSSIAQAGYILVGLVAGNANGFKGVFFYSLVYVFANLGAFTILMRVESAEQSSQIDALNGLSRRSPLMAAVMTVCLLSLAGIPPLAGFAGKWYLFSGAVEAGYLWLALIGLLMSMVSVYYYLSVVKAMYIGESSTGSLPLNGGEKAAIWACFVLTVLAGVYPAPVVALAKLAWAAIGS